MHVKSELENLNDTAAIEYLGSIVTGSNLSYKQAFDISGILGGVESAIKRHVLSQVDRDKPIESVINLLAPAALFRLHPLLAGFQMAAQSFGISLVDIFNTVADQVKSILQQKGAVPKEDITNLGQSMLVTAASKDPLIDLKRMYKSGKLEKIAQRRQPTGGYFLNPPKGTSALERVFGFLGKRKGQNLLVGISIWLIKTILASAGLLLIGGVATDVARDVIGYGKSNEYQKPPNDELVYVNAPNSQKPTAVKRPPPAQVPSTQPSQLRPSGAGTQFHKNDQNSIWVIPAQNVERMLINWATEIYPQLRGKENTIKQTQSFNKMANLLRQYISDAGYLVMPPDFHRRIDVVNTFARDVESKLPQEAVNV